MRKLLSLFALWRDPDWRKLFIVCAVIVLIAAAGVQMDRINPFAVYNIWNVTREPGATADAQIASCLTNRIPSGGVCDARGFGQGIQPWAANVSVAAGQTVLFDLSTKFQPASSAVNMLTIQTNAHVYGFHANLDNQPSYSGKVVTIANATTVDGTATIFKDFLIEGLSETTGIAVYLLGTDVNLNRVAFTGISSGRIAGLSDGIRLETTGTAGGWVNGVIFTDIHISGSQFGFTFNSTATGVGASISGNMFTNVSYEKMAQGQKCVRLIGTQPISENRFENLNCWDTVTPFLVSNPQAQRNWFSGRFDGFATAQDNGFNNFNDLTTNQLSLAGTLSTTWAQVNGDTFAALTASTGHKDIHLANTGGALFVAIDNSTGSDFGSGGVAYASNWYSPGNNSFFTTPLATFSGPLTANGKMTGAGLTASGTSLVQVGTTTVGSLPSAASNSGAMIRVSDSTAVAAEGQTCAGGSSNTALAFSNGTVWKCF
jgi:hypothetical protein